MQRKPPTHKPVPKPTLTPKLPKTKTPKGKIKKTVFDYELNGITVNSDAGVFLHFVILWCLINERNENEDYFREGFYWTHISVSDILKDIIKNSTRTKIATAIKSVVKEELVFTEQFPSQFTLRVKWYRPNFRKLEKRGFDKIYLKDLFHVK